MAETHWSKFFWSDWESDEALRQCSLAAQGLWMRMLCICAKGDPIGSLTIAGNPLDASGVAKMACISIDEAVSLLEELAKWGVYSVDRKGRIYSRRMIRDAQRAAKARQNGKLGGNPRLCNKRGISAPDNPPEKPPDKTHKPDTRYQNKKTEGKPSAKKGSRIPDDFKPDIGWAIAHGLPELTANREAEKFRNYWKARPGQGGVKLDWPATWRNWVLTAAERLGLPAAKSPGGIAQAVKEWAADEWAKRLQFIRQDDYWPPELGPPPGSPGCLVPEHLLTSDDINRRWRQAA